MELALNLGMPAERLAREMTEREFQDWYRFAREHVLPFRRVELYLAQVSWAVARFMGGNKNAKISDFMIEFGQREPEPETDGDDDDLDAAKAAFAFAPRKKRSE